ncbi:hypothetical protein [Romboutsia sp. 1001216sp1]|uniref:hypothetical protein n=1 Tax=Romboutsia sp. 1001216sp1 TaxID=2986997 RepID=UPI00232C0074|nr:hypothetical protein [Romboutsia sp. 1001216sp1]MDB8805043.1 hypothetical protein [Romboutsia sp. 1001216sp1]MDB8808033.1 hypothetical protein [Romboutsia sp. 1001216sp1]MDB8810688.1 hypothetical protein [Romboutsia sp. 1001216sp1]MDB8816408.1 hypothetical protein [Romboutsia sp. 1001216sp1]MDB8818639.1 hypothetical protein [Romboutsia sp. 1001216sp1]
MNAVLFDEFPILVDRVLAEKIGLNEAIVIQQLHYWIMQNKRQKKNFYDGIYWTFNSFNKWQSDTFYFWSVRTLTRIFKKLEDEGILLVGNYNKKGYDRTKWYSINYKILNSKCCNNSLGQLDTMDNDNLTSSLGQLDIMDNDNLTQPIPDTTQRLNTETTYISTTQSSAVVDTNKEFIESKTHLKLTNNMKKIAQSWDKERLSKAIELFNLKEGKYFSLLEKIYKDDGNFLNTNSINSKNVNYTNQSNKFANFNQNYLDGFESGEAFDEFVEKKFRKQ